MRGDSPENNCRKSVNVIVVNFNGRHHLEQCLPALEKQTRLADEVIVVDNGSSDGSCEYLRKRHPGMKLIELPENQGFTGGNIAGYMASTGDYIVLLNNDTRPEPDWLEKLTLCADSLSHVGIVASHITDWQGHYTDTAGDGCTVTGRGYKLMHGRSTQNTLDSGYVFSACACAALYRREMLDEIGFFEPSFFMNAEDTDLAFRAQLAGWKAYLCADAVVRHRIGASQQIYSRNHVYYSTRNHVWLYFRCMPWRLVLRYSLDGMLQTLLYLAFYAKQRRLGAYFGGLAAAIYGLPRTLHSRRSIQGSRRVSLRDLEFELASLTTFLREQCARFRRRQAEIR